MVYERLLTTDIRLTEKEWAFAGAYTPAKYAVGQLAESWEQPDPATVIFKIRKGIRWQNLPPLSGRELVAADVVYGLTRYTQQGSLVRADWINWFKSVTAIDKYTVEFKFDPAKIDQWGLWVGYSKTSWIVPREVVEANGDLKNPLVAVGTGPYIIKDRVANSSMTFGKNPTYWGEDPRHPGNTLPYIENVEFIIVPDASTQIAALRTGKVDILGPPQTN
ncbi:MAG: ABC transporter substrate-binding protein, partial [Dehalococcoidales bacterium]|nr:ABC transporter substrate-binding protein [Dehalococcoidales bacterium]